VCEELNNFVIGNIHSCDIECLDRHPVYIEMRRRVVNGIRRCATECKWFMFCGGAYTSNKYFENRDLASTETTACRFTARCSFIPCWRKSSSTSPSPRVYKCAKSHDTRSIGRDHPSFLVASRCSARWELPVVRRYTLRRACTEIRRAFPMAVLSQFRCGPLWTRKQ